MAEFVLTMKVLAVRGNNILGNALICGWLEFLVLGKDDIGFGGAVLAWAFLDRDGRNTLLGFSGLSYV